MLEAKGGASIVDRCPRTAHGGMRSMFGRVNTIFFATTIIDELFLLEQGKSPDIIGSLSPRHTDAFTDRGRRNSSLSAPGTEFTGLAGGSVPRKAQMCQSSPSVKNVLIFKWTVVSTVAAGTYAANA